MNSCRLQVFIHSCVWTFLLLGGFLGIYFGLLVKQRYQVANYLPAECYGYGTPLITTSTCSDQVCSGGKKSTCHTYYYTCYYVDITFEYIPSAKPQDGPQYAHIQKGSYRQYSSAQETARTYQNGTHIGCYYDPLKYGDIVEGVPSTKTGEIGTGIMGAAFGLAGLIFIIVSMIYIIKRIKKNCDCDCTGSSSSSSYSSRGNRFEGYSANSIVRLDKPAPLPTPTPTATIYAKKEESPNTTRKEKDDDSASDISIDEDTPPSSTDGIELSVVGTLDPAGPSPYTSLPPSSNNDVPSYTSTGGGGGGGMGMASATTNTGASTSFANMPTTDNSGLILGTTANLGGDYTNSSGPTSGANNGDGLILGGSGPAVFGASGTTDYTNYTGSSS
eukprot:TRINITY_DN3709_c0_g1_i1.p1 TRINITY_DN3709_c0_g1~~TRINITY_DN3709_c0_g1_i1.p1  ORF type:complete len:388 (+),score=72.37 TRINITY_DN3709_c0_g1_i1:176-1339(+)